MRPVRVVVRNFFGIHAIRECHDPPSSHNNYDDYSVTYLSATMCSFIFCHLYYVR